jgi:hypothetical protein
MTEHTTRISDLPDSLNMSNTYQNQQFMQQSHHQAKVQFSNSAPPQFDSTGGNLQNTYMPMNIHPNPYGGNQPPSQIQPPAYQVTPKNEQMLVSMPSNLTAEQYMVLQNMPQQRLPSRDIPIDTAGYSHDEQIQPNYIPSAKLGSDFVKEYEDLTDKKLERKEKEKYQSRLLDTIISELQTPVIVGLLYFIFQMPFMNNLIFKKFTFFAMYNDDGDINFNGVILKSILFGIMFYGLTKFTSYIIEI